MKKTISSLLLLFMLSFVYGQKDTVLINQIYSDYVTNLVSEKILKFDSIPKNELMIRFENWAGQNFRNYNEVKTSKTESQITLLYIISPFTFLDWYVLMIVEFKDSKIRIRAYDDGNVYKPGSYAGNVYVSAIASRTIFIKNYFRNDEYPEENGMIIYRVNPGIFNFKEKYATGSLKFKNSIESTINEIDKFVKNYSIINNNIKSDW